MEEIYYMSIGYPIGLCENDEAERFYNVENKGEFFGLYNNGYLIWKFCFFDIKTKEEIIEHLYKEFKIPEFSTNLEIERLKSLGLLIVIDSLNINNLFDSIKNLFVVKNGFGIGLNKEGTFSRVMNQGQNFDISIDDFNIWGICNNRKTIKELLAWLIKTKAMDEKTAKNTLINTLFRLKTIDLIRLSN